MAASFWSLSTHGNAQVAGCAGDAATAVAHRPRARQGLSSQEVRAAYPPGAYAALPSFGESSIAIADPSRKLPEAGDQLLLKSRAGHSRGRGRGAGFDHRRSRRRPHPADDSRLGPDVGAGPRSERDPNVSLEKDYYYTATVRLSLERASNPVGRLDQHRRRSQPSGASATLRRQTVETKQGDHRRRWSRQMTQTCARWKSPARGEMEPRRCSFAT